MTQRYIAPALLGFSLLLTACGGSSHGPTLLPLVPPPTTPPPAAQAPQKNVIFFLGDGMGITTMTAARIYKVGEDGDLTMDKLPETAFVHTYSNDAQVTDSAPSMSAYMTGVKMNNEVISMSAETKATDASGKAYHVNFDSTCPLGQRPGRGNAARAEQGQGLCDRRGDHHAHHARHARRHVFARVPPRCRKHHRRGTGAGRRRLQRQAGRRHRRVLRRRYRLLPGQGRGRQAQRQARPDRRTEGSQVQLRRQQERLRQAAD
jgi:hypothetical protein